MKHTEHDYINEDELWEQIHHELFLTERAAQEQADKEIQEAIDWMVASLENLFENAGSETQAYEAMGRVAYETMRDIKKLKI